MPGRGNGTPDMMHLIERAYASAFEPYPFASLLPELSAALGADTAHLNVWVPELGGELASSYAMPEHLVRLYRDYFWRHDVWRHALERRKIPVGRAFTGRQLLPFAALLKSEMYNEALRPYGLFDTCGGRIFENRRAGAAVSLLRARGRPFYGKRELTRLAAVLPHMVRAIDFRVKLSELARERDLIACFADSVSDGVMVVDHGGRVAHATNNARALLDNPVGPLRLMRGHLRARDAAADRRLQALFANRDGSPSWLREAVTMALPDVRAGRVHRLKIVSAGADGGILGPFGRAFLIVIETPEPSGRSAVETFARRHRLTPAETELLSELTRGTTLSRAGELLARSRNTARNQLQSIFAKTGTHRQAELIAKVLRERA